MEKEATLYNLYQLCSEHKNCKGCPFENKDFYYAIDWNSQEQVKDANKTIVEYLDNKEKATNEKKKDMDILVENITQYFLQHKIIGFPCKIENIINILFSNNETIALWIKLNKISYKCIWNGQASDIPEKYKSKSFLRIFGTIPQTIEEADTINILIEE